MITRLQTNIGTFFEDFIHVLPLPLAQLTSPKIIILWQVKSKYRDFINTLLCDIYANRAWKDSR